MFVLHTNKVSICLIFTVFLIVLLYCDLTRGYHINNIVTTANSNKKKDNITIIINDTSISIVETISPINTTFTPSSTPISSSSLSSSSSSSSPPIPIIDFRVRKSSTNPAFMLYLHPRGDLVSDTFYNLGHWPDCLDHLNQVHKYHGNVDKNIVIVDVGTNIGSCSLLFASKGYKVYSFEPVQRNFALLNKSINENTHLEGKIIALMKGVSNESSQEVIHSENSNYGNSIVGKTLSKQELHRLGNGNSQYIASSIYLTTLDQTVKEHVHYMKLDCQGCEFNALRGATKLLGQFKVDVMKLEFTSAWLKTQKQDPFDLLTLLQSYNYALYRENGELIKNSIESFQQFLSRFDESVTYSEDIIAVRMSM